MEDFDTLRENVADTAKRLSQAQADRQARSEELFAMLGRLEKSFDTQLDQLAQYRARVEPLEQANHMLFGLVTGLLDVIEADIAENRNDPLHDATEMVAKMLSRDKAPAPAALSAEDPEEPAEEQAGEDGAAEEPEIWFEDVPDDVLNAELQAGAEPGDTAVPAEASDAEVEALAMSIGSHAAEAETETEAEAEAEADEPAPVEEITAEHAAPDDGAPAPDPEPAEAGTGDADEMEVLTVELDIPSPDADAVVVSETGRAVNDALTEALDTISEAEDAVQSDPDAELPDVRALLRRVEKAALKAQALSQSRAKTVEDAAAAAPEAELPPEAGHDDAAETAAAKDTEAA
jgi:hypothetical protein